MANVDLNIIFPPPETSPEDFQPIKRAAAPIPAPRSGCLVPVGTLAWYPDAGEEAALKTLLTDNPGILVQSRLDRAHPSKLYGSLILIWGQIMAGTFPLAYDWEGRWLKRVHINPQTFSLSDVTLEAEKGLGFEPVLMAVSRALGILQEKLKDGWFWPPQKAGKRTHISFPEFFVAGRPGLQWSPFMELSQSPGKTRLARISHAQGVLGSGYAERVRDIAAQVFQKAASPDMASFVEGAVQLKEWLGALPESIRYRNNEARKGLASFASLLGLVEDYQREHGWVPNTFIHPSSPAWGTFQRYLRKRGIEC